MKNIYILPTHKPSRIYLIKSNNRLGITSNNPEFTENFGSGTQNQNIYITSDEEIKFEDYITDGYLVWKWKDDSSLLGRKKIILTTDQDLIGVQAIDDEFLKWFVKDPSCEEVEIVFNCRGITGAEKILKTFGEYKIIIPKEEPKQETLEKAAEIFYPPKTTDLICSAKLVRDAFKEGAKWQQERSYSEEEVLKFTFYCNENYTFHNNFYIWISNTDFKDIKTTKQLLEQFKTNKIMKQTAVEQLGIAFREWQRQWNSFEERGKDKPVSYDEFIKPFLELEKEQIIDAYNEIYTSTGERYYNKKFKKE